MRRLSCMQEISRRNRKIAYEIAQHCAPAVGWQRLPERTSYVRRVSIWASNRVCSAARRRSAYVVGFALLLLLPVRGIGDIQTTTQTLSAAVTANGKIAVPANVSLRSSDTRFGSLSGSLTVSYWARTSSVAGNSITAQASDFSPAGGPTVGAVSYTCSGATLGTGCSGAQALSAGTQTLLVSLPASACTGGGGACSSDDPNTVVMTFAMPSQPHYKTGNY